MAKTHDDNAMTTGHPETKARLGSSVRAPRIFISYRRSDAGEAADNLANRLRSHYGRDRVFFDVENLAAGPFPDQLRQQLERADVMLVVIGDSWDPARLQQSDDWVRVEIETALQRIPQVRVIPVQVGGTPLPAPAELPEGLLPLLDQQAVEITSGQFENGVRGIIRAIGGPRYPRLYNPLAWAVVTVAVLLVAAIGWWFANPPPTEMTGHFNVAVAKFDAPSGDAQLDLPRVAKRLDNQVYEYLDSVLADLGTQTDVQIQVRPPDQTGPIGGGDVEARAGRAYELATAINADLVLYGTLTGTSNSTQFEPEFVLVDRGALAQANELAHMSGHYRLGSQLEYAGSPPLREQDVGRDLRTRTAAFAELALGLTHFQVGRYADASQHFEKALTDGSEGAGGWPEEDGKEFLYLFLGSTAGLMGDLDVAETNFVEALRLNDEFARGHVGLASVAFARSRCGDTTRRPDATLLDTADGHLRAAEGAAFRPPESDIEPKVAFARARILVCRQLQLPPPTQADVDSGWQEVERLYGIVLDAYQLSDGTHNARLHDVAAQAHMGLGLVVVARDGVDGYETAIARFGEALDAGVAPEVTAAANAWLGWLYSEVGETTEARSHCDDAQRLAALAQTGDALVGQVAGLCPDA